MFGLLANYLPLSHVRKEVLPMKPAVSVETLTLLMMWEAIPSILVADSGKEGSLGIKYLLLLDNYVLLLMYICKIRENSGFVAL